MIDPVVAFNHGVAHRLSLSLATLVVGQNLASESDVPFEPFTAAFDVGTRLTATLFKAALGFEPGRQAVLESAATFFESVGATTDDPGTQQVFAVVEHVMRRSLSGADQGVRPRRRNRRSSLLPVRPPRRRPPGRLDFDRHRDLTPAAEHLTGCTDGVERRTFLVLGPTGRPVELKPTRRADRVQQRGCARSQLTLRPPRPVRCRHDGRLRTRRPRDSRPWSLEATSATAPARQESSTAGLIQLRSGAGRRHHVVGRASTSRLELDGPAVSVSKEIEMSASHASLLSTPSRAVVEATAGVVAEHAEQITARFYGRMFEARPDLLRVFNLGNQATGEQSRALAASVVAYAVQLIDADAPSFRHVMRRIAYKHVSLGVRPEQYTIVGHHLLVAVGEVLGTAVTPEVAAAWDEVYWLFATQLIAEEARLYQQAGVDPLHPLRAYRVVRRIEETQDVISLVLEPADDGPLPAIVPGQYVSVFVDLPDGRRQPRQYTVSSTASGTRLQITVSRVRGAAGAPDGQVSSFLHDGVAIGDLLEVSAPAGDFVVDPLDVPLLLATAGAGITTALPIVEHIARTQPQRKVIVAHADRTAQDHALRDTVLHAGRQIDDFTSYTWYERVDPDDHRSQQGFMDLTSIPLPADVHVFTCGPLPFMRHVRTTLLAARRRSRPHPLRSVRARPVGRPDAARRSMTE